MSSRVLLRQRSIPGRPSRSRSLRRSAPARGMRPSYVRKTSDAEKIEPFRRPSRSKRRASSLVFRTSILAVSIGASCLPAICLFGSKRSKRGCSRGTSKPTLRWSRCALAGETFQERFSDEVVVSVAREIFQERFSDEVAVSVEAISSEEATLKFKQAHQQ